MVITPMMMLKMVYKLKEERRTGQEKKTERLRNGGQKTREGFKGQGRRQEVKRVDDGQEVRGE